MVFALARQPGCGGRALASIPRGLPRLGQRFLIVALGVVLMLIVYSSLNAVLWRQYQSVTDVLWRGTQSVGDLRRGVQDRSLAWTQDVVYFDWLSVDRTLIDYPMGVTGTVEMVDNWWVVLTAAVGLTLLLSLALWMVIQRTTGPRRTGLSPAFYRLDHVRAGRARIARNAVWVFALALPLAGGVAWYVFYDRAQTSTALHGGFRAVRYLFESFSPRGRDWALVSLVGVGAASWYAWWAARRLVRGWPPAVFAPYHERCAGCGYSLESIGERCPECDLPVDMLVRRVGLLTPRRVALGAIAVVVLGLATGSAVVWVRYEGHVYWPVFHWVTMRGETRKFHPHLYILPNRPVMLRWDGVDVWIVVQHREHGTWPTRPDSYYTDLPVVVCKVGNGPAVLIERVEIQSPDPLVIGEEEVLDWALSLGPFPIPWSRTMLYVLPVRAQPDAVEGFGLSGPLTPGAERFLAECDAVVDRWLAQRDGSSSRN